MTVMPRCVIAIALFVLGGASGARRLPAQSLGIAAGRDRPAWMDQWSPLGIQGSLPRTLTGASSAVPLLMLPPPKIGLFWTGGNPGALSWDVDDDRTDVIVARAVQDGEYRRPLDPVAASVTQVNGLGWRPLGSRGAVVGSVLFDRSLRDPASASNMNDPYATSPFVVTDTSTAKLRQSRARLEGAGGWRIGEFGVGVALGYEARTTASLASRLLRRNRAVAPAATVGVVRRFAGGRIAAGLRGSWQSATETINMVEVTQEGGVYQLEGYRDVPLQDIVGGYYRRMSRNVESLGATVGGVLGPARWAVNVDGLRQHERLTGEQEDDPLTESWKTNGTTAAAAVQFPPARDRVMITLQARLAALSGHSAQVFPTRSGLRTNEQVLEGSAQMRLLPSAEGWMAVIEAGLVGEHRVREDSIAQVRTIVDAITSRVGVEVGRQVSEQLIVSAGYGFARYGGNGTLPSPTTRSGLYQRVFAPELDIATSVARAHSVVAALRWQLQSASAVWAAGRIESLAPQSNHLFATTGTRAARTLLLGVMLTGVRR